MKCAICGKTVTSGIVLHTECFARKYRTGTWERYESKSGGVNFRCSACRRYHFHNGAMVRQYKYCPNCGAKMEAMC